MSLRLRNYDVITCILDARNSQTSSPILLTFGNSRYFRVLVSNMKSEFTFENFQNFDIRKHMEW